MADDRKASEQLETAVEALMADRALPSPLPPRVQALLDVAADLRGLPTAAFKAELKAKLRATVEPSHGPALLTAADIEARLAVLAGPPRLVAHDLRAALRDLPELSMRFLASLDAWTVVVSGYATGTPMWERHPAGDELLHVLSGGLDVTTLTADGPVQASVPAGSMFVCRRGLWHWARPRGHTEVLSLTPGEATAHVQADDPRTVPGIPLDVPAATPASAGTNADLWDLPAAIAGTLDGHDHPRHAPEAEANAAVREIGRLEDRLLGVMRFGGETPWERHPDGDELLHVLDGDVDVTVLTDAGPVHVPVAAGGVFVCPRGLWHRQRPATVATLMFATPTHTTEASWADDPRVERSE